MVSPLVFLSGGATAATMLEVLFVILAVFIFDVSIYYTYYQGLAAIRTSEKVVLFPVNILQTWRAWRQNCACVIATAGEEIGESDFLQEALQALRECGQ